jgi:hypothetical protein
MGCCLAEGKKVEKSQGFHFFERSLKYWERGNTTPSVPVPIEIGMKQKGKPGWNTNSRPPPGQPLLIKKGGELNASSHPFRPHPDRNRDETKGETRAEYKQPTTPWAAPR